MYRCVIMPRVQCRYRCWSHLRCTPSCFGCDSATMSFPSPISASTNRHPLWRKCRPSSCRLVCSRYVWAHRRRWVARARLVFMAIATRVWNRLIKLSTTSTFLWLTHVSCSHPPRIFTGWHSPQPATVVRAGWRPHPQSAFCHLWRIRFIWRTVPSDPSVSMVGIVCPCFRFRFRLNFLFFSPTQPPFTYLFSDFKVLILVLACIRIFLLVVLLVLGVAQKCIPGCAERIRFSIQTLFFHCSSIRGSKNNLVFLFVLCINGIYK